MFAIVNFLLIVALTLPLLMGFVKSSLHETQELKDAEIEQGLLAALYFDAIIATILYFYNF